MPSAQGHGGSGRSYLSPNVSVAIAALEASICLIKLPKKRRFEWRT